MTKIFYRNNITALTDAAIIASATSIPLKNGQGEQFGNNFPFPVTLEYREEISGVSVVTRREIALCTARAGDILTVQRAFDACVQDDTVQPPQYTQLALNFPAGTIVQIRLVSKNINDIQNDIEDIKDIIDNPTIGGLMDLSTSQTVAGGAVKYFTNHPRQVSYIAPTEPEQYTPKQYVDDQIVFASTPKHIAGYPVMAGEPLTKTQAVFIEEYPVLNNNIGYFERNGTRTPFSDNQRRGFAINNNTGRTIKGIQITKVSGCAATRVLFFLSLTSTTPNVIVPFVGDVAVLSVHIPNGQSYRIEIDNNGANYSSPMINNALPQSTGIGNIFSTSTNAYLFGNNVNGIFSVANVGEIGIPQNIGDIPQHTRVSSFAFGSGIEGSFIILRLYKVGIPTPNLEIRIETDNGGIPSGTLVHPNATTVIPQSAITTFNNYTINFTGTFTIPRGQKVHVVLRQVGDVVNSLNYYIVYLGNKQTNVRYNSFFNGTTWTTQPQTNTVLLGNTPVPVENGGRIVRFVAKQNVTLSEVIGLGDGPYTYELRLYNASGGTLATAGSTNIGTGPLGATMRKGTFSYLLIAGTEYLLGCIPTSTGPLPAIAYENTIITPSSNFFVDFIGPENHGIVSMKFSGSFQIKQGFFGINTPLLENELLSLADTIFPHRTFVYGFSTTNYTEGQDAVVLKEGEIDGFIRLNKESVYYLSDVGGWLTANPNNYPIGIAKNSNILSIMRRKSIPLNTYIGLNGSGIQTGTYTAIGDGFLLVFCFIRPLSFPSPNIYIENNITGQRFQSTTNGVYDVMVIPMSKGDTCLFTINSNDTLASLMIHLFSFFLY